MQGTTIKLLTGGLLMVAAAGYVQAEALQPDHSAERFQPLYSPPGVDAKRQPADDAGALFMAAEY